MTKAIKATKPASESGKQATAPSLTEAEVVLRNARALRVDLSSALEENRMKAGQLREQLIDLASKRDDLDAKVALMESRLADLDTDLSRAKRTAQLTVGSEIEHSSRRRVEDLMKQRNQLVMDIDATRTDIDVQKIRLDDEVERVQKALSQLVDEEETLTSAIEDIRREEIEAREQRAQEVLAQCECEIEAAEEAYRKAKSEAADLYQQALELRMSAKTKLAELGLAEDAARLAPQFERPITPAERVFKTYREFLVALGQARGVLWDQALDVRNDPRRANRILVETLAVSPSMINDFLYGRDMFLSGAINTARQLEEVTRRTAIEPRRNG